MDLEEIEQYLSNYLHEERNRKQLRFAKLNDKFDSDDDDDTSLIKISNLAHSPTKA